MISIVVAADKNGVIGKDNQLPWKLPNDLKYFKSLTIGNRVLMGRKTYDSIGKPLPDRDNIIITTRPLDYPEGSRLVVRNRLYDALSEFGTTAELFVIGGANIYEQVLPWADRIYLTRIEGEFEGDAFFKLNEAEWKVVQRVKGKVDENNPHPHTFFVYERK